MANEDRKWTVVTGSTGGIGSEIVNILAERQCNLILVNRSSYDGSVQQDKVRKDQPDVAVESVTADLMDAQSVFHAVDEIYSLPGRIDALYNVAGVLNSSLVLSAQGFESNFAVNTLAPYQLIRGLREKMARPSDEDAAVIMNFASSAIKSQKTLDMKNLLHPKEVTGLMGTYAQTKLALTVLTASLAKELLADNILIRAVDPGATKTAMTTQNSAMPRFLQILAPIFFGDARKSAAIVVESAKPTAFDARSGVLVSNGRERRLPLAAKNLENLRRIKVLLDHTLQSVLHGIA